MNGPCAALVFGTRSYGSDQTGGIVDDGLVVWTAVRC